MKHFYMIWKSSPGGNAPSKVHETLESAKIESERLAENNPGNVFVVLKAISACQTAKPSVTWLELEDA